MMNSLQRGFLAALLCALGIGQAPGASLNVPLRELTAAPDMVLRCITDRQILQVPLPERWAVRGVGLALRYTVSNNVARDVSQLVVKVNDVMVAQMRLNPQSPEPVNIPIPLHVLQPGYNRVTFESIQHSANVSRMQCVSPCSPDMWTSIDLKESSIAIEYDLKPVPLELAKLSGFVFDPRLMPDASVHIVTQDLSEAAVNAAAVVASGIARRFDYRRVSFSVSRELDPERDNVLVGELAYVTEFLGRRGIELAAEKGGYLRLLHMPGANGTKDARRALLVVSGETRDAVRLAAMTFSTMSSAFPGSDAINVFKFAVPELQQYSGREVLSSDRAYALKTLGVGTHSFRGFNSGARTVAFRLPVDFHIRPNQYAALRLNFSYGAGMRNDSTLSVLVNGASVRAIPLSESGGTLVEAYKIDIPTYLFKPGANIIELVPSLHVIGQVCDLIQPDNLFLTVYDNSTLEFPPMPHLVQMPRLDLFMYNGFPVTRWPDGHEATMLLAEADDAVLAAGLNLLGLITQKNGFPLFGLSVSYAPGTTNEAIVIGALGKLPEALRKAAPLVADGSVSAVPYPVIQSWSQEVSIAYATQTGALGPRRGLLMQFQSPLQTGRTVTVLTASDNKELLAVSRELLKPAVQSQARGDITLIELDTPEAKVSAIDTGARYVTGKQGSASMIAGALYAFPALHYAVLGALLALVSVVIYVLMRRRRRKAA